MKPVCCDTSFLMALYGNDIHTQKALYQIRSLTRPITLSILNEFELENALHFACWRKVMSFGEVLLILSRLETDRELERVVASPVNLSQVVIEARRLSKKYAATSGYRTFDLLHVAAALILKADEFLSFDLNQRQLAKTVGLKLNA